MATVDSINFTNNEAALKVSSLPYQEENIVSKISGTNYQDELINGTRKYK